MLFYTLLRLIRASLCRFVYLWYFYLACVFVAVWHLWSCTCCYWPVYYIQLFLSLWCFIVWYLFVSLALRRIFVTVVFLFLSVWFFFVTFTALCEGEALFMKLWSGFAAACSHSLSVVVSHISLLCFHKQCEFSE